MSETFDADFERDILIQSAQDPAFRKHAKRIVTHNDPWSVSAHKYLWEIIAQLGDRDTLTSKMIAKKLNLESDDDLIDAVGKLSKKVIKGKAVSPDYGLEELRKWTRKTTIQGTLSDIIKDMKTGDIEEAEKRIAKLSRSANKIVDDESGDWFDGWEERQAKRLEEKLNPDLRPRIKTRFKRLDKIMNGGLAPEQMGLILGHTNVGKSIAAMNFAFYAAAAEIPTLYISTEMSKEIIDTRIDSRFMARPTEDFFRHNFTRFDLEEFEDRRARLKKRFSGNLLTVATPMNTLTRSMIEGYIDEINDRGGKQVKLIVIDCGDHMVPEVPIREIRHQQIAVYWDLKSLIATRQIACWATVHASGDKKALLTEFDMAESKDKGKIADLIITLNQTVKERMDDRLRLYVAKNRTGEKGAIINLKANYAHSLFEEMTEEEEEERSSRHEAEE